MSRTCARPGCSNSAVATLSYAYADSVVWLEDLAPESHPMIHDLCGLHSANVRVPRGWDLRDTRDAPGDSRRLDEGVAAYAGDVRSGGAGGLRLVGA